MGVDLKKINAEAPHLVSTINMVKKISMEKGINPDNDAAQVVATFDFSGSTEDGRNTLYSDGTMENISQLASAVGFTFDDDGEIPHSLFHNSAIDLGNLTPATSDGFITRAWRQNGMGGTSYLSALRWIVESVGLGDVDLGRRGDPLEVKATAPIAVYAYFVTDGEPQDSKEAIREYLFRMSQLPIFVQFIGVGRNKFQFLNELDTLKGRLVDNAGFFDAKDVLGGGGLVKRSGLFGRSSQPTATGDQIDDEKKQKMLEKMLSEFPLFYKEARSAGLVTQ